MRLARRIFQLPLFAYCLLIILSQSVSAEEQPAAEVLFVKGVATAQQADEPLRVIGKGDRLNQGDKLDTGDKSFALIKLSDGTRMTLRPDTALVLDKVIIKKDQESGLLSLLKGGLRTVTGFIGKRQPGDFRIKTPTSTIGIRGTEFDARICEEDCSKEVAQESTGADKQALAKAISQPVVARAVLVRGVVTVKVDGKPDRLLSKGGPVYEGDIIDTALSAMAVLAFRDQTKLTVQSNTTFKVDSYHFKNNQQATTVQRENNVAFRLIKGGLRMLTGLIGKQEPNNVRLSTPVATIGIRGTGVDALCGAGCVDTSQGTPDLQGIPDGLHTYVWEGNAVLKMASGTYSIQDGKAFFLAAGAAVPIQMPVIPIFIRDNAAPRPDGVDADFEDLFGSESADGSEPGLYVTVKDGHVTLETDGKVIDLGGGDTGYSPGPKRIWPPPPWVFRDPYPAPWEFDERVQHIIDLISDESDGLECTI